MAGVFSQLELAIIRARVRSGMENAKAKEEIIGRPQVTKDDIPTLFLKHYPSFKSGNLNVSEFARVCDMSRTTILLVRSIRESTLHIQLKKSDTSLWVFTHDVSDFFIILQ